MKKKIVKNKSNKKSLKWLWFMILFVCGFIIGYATHYTIVNWNGFFVVCPDDGTRPDKNGCCTGEIYMDAGDGFMVCCPNGADHCFPPIK